MPWTEKSARRKILELDFRRGLKICPDCVQKDSYKSDYHHCRSPDHKPLCLMCARQDSNGYIDKLLADIYKAYRTCCREYMTQHRCRKPQTIRPDRIQKPPQILHDYSFTALWHT